MIGLVFPALLMATALFGDETPELRLRPGLTSPVTAVAFSPDGRVLASGQADGTLRLWDPVSGGELLKLSSREGGQIAFLAFSPDGQSIVSSNDDGFRIWEIATAKAELIERQRRAASEVVFSHDGRLMADCAGEPALRQPKTGKLLRGFSNEGNVEASCKNLAFTPDGRKLISTIPQSEQFFAHSPLPGTKGGLWIWGVESGKLERVLRAPGTHVYGPVSFHPGGRYLASGGSHDAARKHALQIWDFASGEVTRTIAGLPDAVNALAWSPDGRFLASGNGHLVVHEAYGRQYPTLTLWDPTTGAKLHGFGDFGDYVHALAWSPDSRYLASASTSGLVLWEATTGRRVHEMFSDEILASDAVGFAPDGHLFSIGGGRLSYWDLQTLQRSAIRGPVESSTVVAASADGQWIASAVEDRTRVPWEEGAKRPVTVHLWSATEDSWRRFEAHSVPVLALSWSPDARLLASAAGGYESFAPQSDGPSPYRNELRIWDAETGRLVHRLYDSANHGPGDSRAQRIWARSASGLDEQVDRVRALLFTPDGRWLVAGGGGAAKFSELTVWDVRTGERLAARWSDGDHASDLHRAPLAALAFNSDGSRLASGDDDGKIKLWGVPRATWSGEGPRVEQTLDGAGAGITALTFLDDETLASGDAEGVIQLWSLRDGREKAVLKGHTDQVSSLAAHPDGLLASASVDRSVRLWDQVRGEERLSLLALASGDDTIAFTPDLHYMATRDSRDLIFFAVGDRLLPFAQFDLRLNRPDLVLARLPQADPELVLAWKRAREQRLERMGYSEDMLADDFHLPTLELVDANLPNFTSESALRLTFAARDAESPLQSLAVWVNGVPLASSRGFDLDGKRQTRVEVEVPLSAGENRIEAAARNRRGAESLLVRRRIVRDGPAASEKLFVLAVGISRYQDAEQSLRYAAKDAEDIAETFRRSSRHADVRVEILLDGEATRERILAARSFLAAAGIDDQVVVFVAGHGVLDARGDFHFAPHDMDFADPRRRGIAYEDLEGLVDGITARKKLMMIDSCFSGELEILGPEAVDDRFLRAFERGAELLEIPTESAGNGMAAVLETRFVDLRRGTGTTVISAASGRQYALEEPRLKNGVFTYTVRRGIMTREADRDGDGAIMASELRDYVVARVQLATDGNQRPTVRRENLAHDFRVW